MNIFEALEKGKGKATLPCVCSTRYATKELKWYGYIEGLGYSEDEIVAYDLTRDTWMPYVPRKTTHREVFENVIWLEDSDKIATTVVYPYCKGKPLAFKPLVSRRHTKVIIEWEE